MRRLVPLSLVLFAAVAGSATAAGSYPVDIGAKLRPQVAIVKRKPHVSVLLPGLARAILPARRLYGDAGRLSHGGYELDLGTIRGCHGANYCVVGAFLGIPGEKPSPGGRKVRLRGGIVGRYHPVGCGASCSKPRIEFVRRGVLYDLEWEVPAGRDERATLVRLADSALAHGPR